jgi:hypothetical protein
VSSRGLADDLTASRVQRCVQRPKHSPPISGQFQAFC